MRIRFCTLPFTILFSVSCFLIAANVVMVSSSGQAQVEVSKPIGLNGLSQALKIGGLTPEKLVQLIRERGVSFKVDVEIEKQLRNAGADEKVSRLCAGVCSPRSASVNTVQVCSVR